MGPATRGHHGHTLRLHLQKFAGYPQALTRRREVSHPTGQGSVGKRRRYGGSDQGFSAGHRPISRAMPSAVMGRHVVPQPVVAVIITAPCIGIALVG